MDVELIAAYLLQFGTLAAENFRAGSVTSTHHYEDVIFFPILGIEEIRGIKMSNLMEFFKSHSGLGDTELEIVLVSCSCSLLLFSLA